MEKYLKKSGNLARLCLPSLFSHRISNLQTFKQLVWYDDVGLGGPSTSLLVGLKRKLL